MRMWTNAQLKHLLQLDLARRVARHSTDAAQSEYFPFLPFWKRRALLLASTARAATASLGGGSAGAATARPQGARAGAEAAQAIANGAGCGFHPQARSSTVVPPPAVVQDAAQEERGPAAARAEAASPTHDRTAAPEAAPAAEEDKPQGKWPLQSLISFLEEEVRNAQIKERASFATANAARRQAGLDPSVWFRQRDGLRGQAALDMYVKDIVAIVRDFPYHGLSESREICGYVRDEIVAPCFKGRWDFYTNRKRAGFDPISLEQMLCGQNQLLDRLKHAQVQLNV